MVIAEDDIAPSPANRREMIDDFENYLNNLHVEYERKSAKDDRNGQTVPVYVIKIKGKDEGRLIKRFIVKDLGYSEDDYFRCYPEMRQFEHFDYLKANKIYAALNESVHAAHFPYNEDLFDELSGAFDGSEVSADDAEGSNKSIVAIIKSDADYDTLLNLVSDWYKVNKEDIDDEEFCLAIEDKLKKYGLDPIVETDEIPQITNYADKEGIPYDETEGGIEFNPDDLTVESAKAIVDIAKKCGAMNESVAELDRLVKLNEGFTITIEDKESGKKTTIDTDDMKNDDDDEKDDDKEKDSNTSFEDDTELFDTTDGAEENGDSQNGEQQQETKECASSSAPKKFKFKVKSVKESASPDPMFVEPEINSGAKVMYKGHRGQVTGKRSDGRYIVIVCGHTYVCDGKDLKLVNGDAVLDYYSKLDLEGMKTK